MKIRPVRAKLFHANGRTDRQKLLVAFRNFGKAPKKTLLCKIAYPLIQVPCPTRKPNTNMHNVQLLI